ncbi:hypothetical protein JCM10908_001307 [Rhodotorula pacifica]|uniref:uncharacterized protein n=1 Tax=Rhodotorula pacifica TaxID=1495444 RepID=UPI00316D7072
MDRHRIDADTVKALVDHLLNEPRLDPALDQLVSPHFSFSLAMSPSSIVKFGPFSPKDTHTLLKALEIYMGTSRAMDLLWTSEFVRVEETSLVAASDAAEGTQGTRTSVQEIWRAQVEWQLVYEPPPVAMHASTTTRKRFKVFKTGTRFVDLVFASKNAEEESNGLQLVALVYSFDGSLPMPIAALSNLLSSALPRRVQNSLVKLCESSMLVFLRFVLSVSSDLAGTTLSSSHQQAYHHLPDPEAPSPQIHLRHHQRHYEPELQAEPERDVIGPRRRWSVSSSSSAKSAAKEGGEGAGPLGFGTPATSSAAAYLHLERPLAERHLHAAEPATAHHSSAIEPSAREPSHAHPRRPHHHRHGHHHHHHSHRHHGGGFIFRVLSVPRALIALLVQIFQIIVVDFLALGDYFGTVVGIVVRFLQDSTRMSALDDAPAAEQEAGEQVATAAAAPAPKHVSFASVMTDEPEPEQQEADTSLPLNPPPSPHLSPILEASPPLPSAASPATSDDDAPLEPGSPTMHDSQGHAIPSGLVSALPIPMDVDAHALALHEQLAHEAAAQGQQLAVQLGERRSEYEGSSLEVERRLLKAHELVAEEAASRAREMEHVERMAERFAVGGPGLGELVEQGVEQVEQQEQEEGELVQQREQEETAPEEEGHEQRHLAAAGGEEVIEQQQEGEQLLPSSIAASEEPQPANSGEEEEEEKLLPPPLDSPSSPTRRPRRPSLRKTSSAPTGSSSAVPTGESPPAPESPTSVAQPEEEGAGVQQLGIEDRLGLIMYEPAISYGDVDVSAELRPDATPEQEGGGDNKEKEYPPEPPPSKSESVLALGIMAPASPPPVARAVVVGGTDVPILSDPAGHLSPITTSQQEQQRQPPLPLSSSPPPKGVSPAVAAAAVDTPPFFERGIGIARAFSLGRKEGSRSPARGGEGAMTAGVGESGVEADGVVAVGGAEEGGGQGGELEEEGGRGEDVVTAEEAAEGSERAEEEGGGEGGEFPFVFASHDSALPSRVYSGAQEADTAQSLGLLTERSIDPPPPLMSPSISPTLSHAPEELEPLFDGESQPKVELTTPTDPEKAAESAATSAGILPGSMSVKEEKEDQNAGRQEGGGAAVVSEAGGATLHPSGTYTEVASEKATSSPTSPTIAPSSPPQRPSTPPPPPPFDRDSHSPSATASSVPMQHEMSHSGAFTSSQGTMSSESVEQQSVEEIQVEEEKKKKQVEPITPPLSPTTSMTSGGPSSPSSPDSPSSPTSASGKPGKLTRRARKLAAGGGKKKKGGH